MGGRGGEREEDRDEGEVEGSSIRGGGGGCVYEEL